MLFPQFEPSPLLIITGPLVNVITDPPLSVISADPPLNMITDHVVNDPSPPAPLDPMGALWHTQFDALFSSFWPSNWRLIPKPLVDCSVDEWNVHKDAAKVRFLCEVCGHGWTSMKGRVVFWYHYDYESLQGTVAFSLFGQKCQECSQRGVDNFTNAMWYQEEVVKVLCNAYYSVGVTYYGFERPSYMNVRRPGKPRSQHAAELCQACQAGVCATSMWKKDHSDQCINRTM